MQITADSLTQAFSFHIISFAHALIQKRTCQEGLFVSILFFHISIVKLTHPLNDSDWLESKPPILLIIHTEHGPNSLLDAHLLKPYLGLIKWHFQDFVT